MINFISFLVLIVGGANWLAIGMLQYDFVAGLFGSQASIFSRIVYILVGFSAIWLIVSAIRQKGKINILKDKIDSPVLKKQDEALAEKFHQE